MSYHKTLGSTCIIAGTSIGAGMLALPLVTESMGFLLSLVFMIIVWGLANYSALLIAEACCACPQANTLHDMAGKLLGRPGQLVAIVAMLGLFYALCAAYITEGAIHFSALLIKCNITLSHSQSSCFLAVLMGCVVYLGISILDIVNRILFLLMIVALVMVFIGLLPNVHNEYLLVDRKLSYYGFIVAIPVLYTSFGYHGSLPTVINYLDHKPKAFRMAIVCGGLIPLVIYVLWQMVVFGSLAPQEINTVTSVEFLVQSLHHVAGFMWFHDVVNYFAILALGTSFLGVMLGLFEYLLEACQGRSKKKIRLYVVLLTLLPPLSIAIYAPESFIFTLGYAAVGLVVLAIYLPVCMVVKVRKMDMNSSGYHVSGGVLGMLVAILLGTCVVLFQIGITLFM